MSQLLDDNDRYRNKQKAAEVYFQLREKEMKQGKSGKIGRDKLANAAGVTNYVALQTLQELKLHGCVLHPTLLIKIKKLPPGEAMDVIQQYDHLKTSFTQKDLEEEEEEVHMQENKRRELAECINQYQRKQVINKYANRKKCRMMNNAREQKQKASAAPQIMVQQQQGATTPVLPQTTTAGTTTQVIMSPQVVVATAQNIQKMKMPDRPTGIIGPVEHKANHPHPHQQRQQQEGCITTTTTTIMQPATKEKACTSSNTAMNHIDESSENEDDTSSSGGGAAGTTDLTCTTTAVDTAAAAGGGAVEVGGTLIPSALTATTTTTAVNRTSPAITLNDDNNNNADHNGDDEDSPSSSSAGITYDMLVSHIMDNEDPNVTQRMLEKIIKKVLQHPNSKRIIPSNEKRNALLRQLLDGQQNQSDNNDDVFISKNRMRRYLAEIKNANRLHHQEANSTILDKSNVDDDNRSNNLPPPPPPPPRDEENPDDASPSPASEAVATSTVCEESVHQHHGDSTGINSTVAPPTTPITATKD